MKNLKALAKSTFLKKNLKFTSVSNFTVNELLPATVSWSKNCSKLSQMTSPSSGMVYHTIMYKTESDVVNISKY